MTVTELLRQMIHLCPLKFHVLVVLLDKYAEILVRIETFYKNIWKNNIRRKINHNKCLKVFAVSAFPNFITKQYVKNLTLHNINTTIKTMCKKF